LQKAEEKKRGNIEHWIGYLFLSREVTKNNFNSSHPKNFVASAAHSG